MALTPLFVPGLLANDMDRTSPLRVVAGAGLAAAFVVPTTWWIQSIVEGGTLELPWILLALSTAARAQSAIAGVVRDASGAVLPGVTVEVSSDALIEKTRSVATDGEGQYISAFCLIFTNG